MKSHSQVPSIYVSISTLEDEEIVDTIYSALNKSRNDVNVGVAFTTSKNFYEEKIKQMHGVKNFRHMWLDPKENIGLGKGRNNAKNMYREEDYFLQIDGHTEFSQGWDDKLINIYKEAKTQTKLDKFVLTAGLGKYTKKNNQRKIIDDETSYVVIKSKYFIDGTTNVPDSFGQKIKQFPDFFKTKKRFIPANRVCGSFIFGDHQFPKNYGLPWEAIFNDEQLMHSVNLLYDGFALVFFNGRLPLAHYYYQEMIANGDAAQTFNDIKQKNWGEVQSKNVENFVENNPKKCEYYKKYCTYDLTNGTCIDYYIPNKFKV